MTVLVSPFVELAPKGFSFALVLFARGPRFVLLVGACPPHYLVYRNDATNAENLTMNTPTESEVRRHTRYHGMVIRKHRSKNPADPDNGKYQITYGRTTGAFSGSEPPMFDGAWLTLPAIQDFLITVGSEREATKDEVSYRMLTAAWHAATEEAQRRFVHARIAVLRDDEAVASGRKIGGLMPRFGLGTAAAMETLIRFREGWDHANKRAKERLLRFINDGVDLGPSDATWSSFLKEWDGHQPERRAQLRTWINHIAETEGYRKAA